MSKNLSACKEKNINIFVALAITAVCVAFFIVAYFKVDGFLLASGDTAVAEQSFWNTINGDFFYQSSLIGVDNNFREHLNFVQFLYLPFYAVIPSLMTLYAIINIAYGISAFALFRFARERIGVLGGIVSTFFFLLQPIAILQNIDAMHVVAIGAPFLLLTLIFYEQRKYWVWFAFMLLTVLTTEFIAPTVFLLGVLAFWDRRSWKWIIPPMVFSVLMYIASAWYIKIGFSKNDAILKSFSSIERFNTRFGRIKDFMMPAMYFLPFFSKYMMLLIPTILLDLYVIDINRLFPGSHLLSLVPPILTIAMIDVLQKSNLIMRKVIYVLLVLGLIISVPIWWKSVNITPNKKVIEMREAIELVKDDASVTTARRMGVALNHRKDFYLLDNLKLSDYMVIDKTTGEYTNKSRRAFFDSIELSGNYLKIMDKNDIVVYVTKEKLSQLLNIDVITLEKLSQSEIVDALHKIR